MTIMYSFGCDCFLAVFYSSSEQHSSRIISKFSLEHETSFIKCLSKVTIIGSKDFLSWDDNIDLDNLLGEYMADENEKDTGSVKEKVIYVCPDCDKEYKTFLDFEVIPLRNTTNHLRLENMLTLSRIRGKIKTAVCVPVTKLCLSRPLSVSVCIQKMAEPTSPPSGAFKLNPLNRKPAFSDGTESNAAREPVNRETPSNMEIKDSSQIPTKSHQEEKPTVLPPSLLEAVTELVKQQIVTVPSPDVDQERNGALDQHQMETSDNATEHSLVVEDTMNKQCCKENLLGEELEDSGILPDTSVTSEADLQTLDQEVDESTEAVSESSHLTKAVHTETENLAEERDVNITGEKISVSVIVNDVTDPFGGLELDKADVERKGSFDETTILPDVAGLFSGELEKRRKKELKKSKLKAWKKEREKKKRKHETKEVTSDSEKTEDEPKKPPKPAVNYFVAVQISNPKIQAALKKVQDEAVSVCKELCRAMNRPATLHLTMFVLSINSEDEMLRSKLALDGAQKKLQPLFSTAPLSLDITGLGHFRNEVVFAKVKLEDQVSQLQHIAEVVEDSFLEQELVSPDKKGFKPHITIMKLSFLKGRKRKVSGLKKIDEKLYKEHLHAEFGNQKVDTLQLCSILKKKDESGYYHVDHKVQFAASVEDVKTVVGIVPEDGDKHVIDVLEEDRNLDIDAVEEQNKKKEISVLGNDTENCLCKTVTETGEISVEGKFDIDKTVPKTLNNSVEEIIAEARSVTETNKMVDKSSSQTVECDTVSTEKESTEQSEVASAGLTTNTDYATGETIVDCDDNTLKECSVGDNTCSKSDSDISNPETSSA